MKMLVDGDIVVYRCAFAAEHTKYLLLDDEGQPFAGPFNSAKERDEYIKETDCKDLASIESYKTYDPVSHALANAKSTINRIAKVGDIHGIFLSKGDCFRHRIATMLKYKGNRDDAPRPKHYQAVRDYLVSNYGALEFTSIEADDALAMCQNDHTAIASIDKDLLQVPGNHYNWVHDADDTDRDGKVYVSPEVGERKLMIQTLTGDATDNIPGIKGVGDKTARKLLAEIEIPELRLECLRIWTEYMNTTETYPIKDMDYNSESQEVTYTPWNRTKQVVTGVEEIMREVYRLVKVGGNDAEKAAYEAGEEILLPR